MPHRSLLYKTLRDSFPIPNFFQGQEFQRKNLVKILFRSEDESELDGIVQDTQGKTFSVSVDLFKTPPQNIKILGTCSCSDSHECEHIAALLLEMMRGNIEESQIIDEQNLAVKVNDWLAQWDKNYPQETVQNDQQKQILYILYKVLHQQQEKIFLRLILSQTQKNRLHYTPYTLDHLTSETSEAFIQPLDHLIIRRIRGGPKSFDGCRILEREEGSEILPYLCETNRCYWESQSGLLLKTASPRQGQIQWAMLPDGSQKPEIFIHDDAIILPFNPPYFLDIKTGDTGIASTDLSESVTAFILSAPPIPASLLPDVRKKIKEQFPSLAISLPQIIEKKRSIEVPPVPHLLLHHQKLKTLSSLKRRSNLRNDEDSDVALVRLSFFYENHQVQKSFSRKQIVYSKKEGSFEIIRHLHQEQKFVRDLEEFGFQSIQELARWSIPQDCIDDFSLGESLQEDKWAQFMTELVPSLRQKGWIIDIANDFPMRIIYADGEIDALLEPGSGIDWFELDLGINIDGERINLIPSLIKFLKTMSLDQVQLWLENKDKIDREPVRITLDDGRILMVPFDRLSPILIALTSLFIIEDLDPNDKLQFHKTESADLDFLIEALPQINWHGADNLRALGKRLRDHLSIPMTPLPSSFKGELRPYQQKGLDWMQLLRDVGLGGILADDMGLGKTVQTLAHIAVEKSTGRMKHPCLIVAPTSLMANWRSEASLFVPHLSVLVLQGQQRHHHFTSIGRYDIVLTTYPLLARDSDILRGQSWYMLILDEAQFVKNPVTSAAKILRSLKAQHRLALSGTPLENHLGELWSLFDFIMPGYLGDRTGFSKQWRGPIERMGNDDRRQMLVRRIKPFILRRTKEQVASDLPPKTEIIGYIDLEPAQRDIYEAIRLTMHKKVREAVAQKGLKRSRIELLDALLKLRQVCCDPRLVKNIQNNAQAGSAKLSFLIDMIKELLDEGRRILLFSQFTSMLALIEEALEEEDIPYLILTGDTKDRGTPVKKFQAGEVPLFLISLKAGGTGLNLTAADTVIHYDPWWNPAVEAQATDRAHRIGQDKPVFVHKLIATDSIEFKMAELKARKQALADGILSSESAVPYEIGEDDIEFLLG